jgi:mono/diheme cytochrome c family protein
MNTKSLMVPMAALVLAACGGGDKAPEAATPATPAAAAPAETTPSPAAAPSGAAATPVATAGLNGQAEYAVCSACHQQNGQGVPGAFPPLAGSEWVTGDPKIPIAIVLHGMQGPITVKGQEYNGVMMPWAALSDAQIAAIATYVRSSWGNTASAVTAADVAAVRAATASRKTQWTAAEVRAAKLN